MHRRVRSGEADGDGIASRVDAPNNFARLEDGPRGMLAGHRAPQLSHDGVVETEGNEIIERSISVDDAYANEARLRQGTCGRADMTKERSRITLGHQPLR